MYVLLCSTRAENAIGCTVCFQWNIPNNRVRFSAQRVVTPDYGAGGYLKER